MPWAPEEASRLAYWSKSTACALPLSTSVLVFQLYSSDSDPPGKRTTFTPAPESSPGTAASVRAAS